MSDSNPPLYLPSGYLISEKAKTKLIAESNNGQTLEQLLLVKEAKDIKLKCPFTERVFAEPDVRKVYFS